MNQGWFKIWRQVESNWVWDDKPFARGQAWVDLISRATYKDGGESVFFMNRVFALQRGELVTSLRILAKEWGWSTKKVSKFLDDLHNDKMIEKRNSDLLRIYIMNYEKFQPIDEERKHRGNTKETARKHRGNTSNEVQESKEGKRNDREKRFQKPTTEEVKAYCEERKNGIDPQRFIDFYESKGWLVGRNPMKDWQAAVRTWEKRDADQKPKRSGKYDHLITKA